MRTTKEEIVYRGIVIEDLRTQLNWYKKTFGVPKKIDSFYKGEASLISKLIRDLNILKEQYSDAQELIDELLRK